MALHIVQGNKGKDKQDLQRAARLKRRLPTWIAPKSAVLGDEVVIYVGKHFFATALVDSEPHPRPDWVNGRRYGTALRSVRLIEPPVSLATIQSRIPSLAWARYPRSIKTAEPANANAIRRLIRQRRSLKAADVLARLDLASFLELYALAKAASRPSLAPKLRMVKQRDRIRIIHKYVLERAGDECEGCRRPAPFYRKDGSPFLETHHTKEVARGGADDPDVVIALCPTCHARVHHSADKTAFNRSLIKKLPGIIRRSLEHQEA